MGIPRFSLLLLLLLVVAAPLTVRCADGDLDSLEVGAEDEDDATEDREKFLIKTKACYGDLGCFSTTGKFFDAIKRPVVMVPQSPDKIDTKFVLYTRRNPASGATLRFNDADSVRRSEFSKRRPTKLIIHGFLGRAELTWMNDIRRALLKRLDCNVIQVGWQGGAVTAYNQAASNARVVGAVVARMLAWMVRRFGLNSNDVHLIGHSLGAHVSGYAGERMRASRHPISRITGLDPAGPYFEGTDPIVRLDPSDAGFVDAVHTDAGFWRIGLPVLSGGFGTKSEVGHVDFFVNGGHHQPGCSSVTACDHARATALFTDTIKQTDPAKFSSFPCDNYQKFLEGKCGSRCPGGGCPSMGYMADLQRGKFTSSRPPHRYYLLTSGDSPFYVIHYHIDVILSSKSPSGRVGKLSVQLISKRGKKCGPHQLVVKRELEPRSHQRGVFGCDWKVPDDSPELQISWQDESFTGHFTKHRIDVDSAVLTEMVTGRVRKFCRFGHAFGSKVWARGRNC